MGLWANTETISYGQLEYLIFHPHSSGPSRDSTSLLMCYTPRHWWLSTLLLVVDSNCLPVINYWEVFLPLAVEVSHSNLSYTELLLSQLPKSGWSYSCLILVNLLSTGWLRGSLLKISIDCLRSCLTLICNSKHECVKEQWWWACVTHKEGGVHSN